MGIERAHRFRCVHADHANGTALGAAAAQPRSQVAPEGARAASLAYFGKEPRRLSLGEAALLVALPQSPERLRPDRHPDAAFAARAKVLRRLEAHGALSQSEVADATREPLPATRLALP